MAVEFDWPEKPVIEDDHLSDVLSLLRRVNGDNSTRVVAAAFYIVPKGNDPRKVGTIISAPPPARHHNLFAVCLSPDRQGFLLSDGTFVDRIEAAQIALANGQAKELAAPPHLFSEDLW